MRLMSTKPTSPAATRPGVSKKKPTARAWNADGFYVFWLDGRCEWNGAKSIEETLTLYSEKARRKIIAVILKEALPSGAYPVKSDLAFVVCRTRIQKSAQLIPRREAGL
jgi:hypothetical protein